MAARFDPRSLPGELPSELPGEQGGEQPHDSGRNAAMTSGNDLPGELTGSAGRPAPRLPVSIGRGGGQAPASTCVPGPAGRVIPNRHGDLCPGPACPGCQPCPGPHCTTCRRNHADTTCPSCLADTRTDLDTVAELAARLPEEAASGRHAFHTHEGIPGGDALVMLTPAAQLRGRDLQPVTSDAPNDPRPPLDVLLFWEETWRAQTGNPADDLPNLGDALSYLDGQLHLIAQHRLFPHLAKDLARLVHQLENVTHAGYRPDVSRVPCLKCSTRLIKVYADQPAHDHWRCSTCGETYDRGRYERAQHHHLASKGAERYVPVSDAQAATGRPEQTIRTWIRKDWISTTRDSSGRVLVWWPDVRARHLTTPTRRRTA